MTPEAKAVRCWVWGWAYRSWEPSASHWAATLYSEGITDMRMFCWLLLAGLSSCDALWMSSLVPNPLRCDVTASVCAPEQVCDLSSGTCVDARADDGHSTHCGRPWRTGSAAASFQRFSTLVSTGTAGDLVSVSLGDLDGNGIPDLAAVSDAGTLWAYLGSGDGQLTLRGSESPGGSAGLLRLADLNGDGRADFVVSNPGSNQLRTILSTTDGGFGAAVTVPVTGLRGAFTVADLDRSGHPDVAAALTGNSGLAVLIGDGSGGLASAQGVANSRSASSVLSGDFDGDGLSDLAALEANGGEVQVYLNNNAGQSYLRRSTPLPDPLSARSAASGDFDCDGRLDLALATAFRERILILFGDGQGRFSAATSATTAAEPRELAVADFDGDGNLDIAYFDTTGELFTLRGNGNRQLTGPPVPVLGAQVSASLQVSDVNRDGKPDLVGVWQQKSVAAWLNTTP
jgi:hypothetical protein